MESSLPCKFLGGSKRGDKVKREDTERKRGERESRKVKKIGPSQDRLGQ